MLDFQKIVDDIRSSVSFSNGDGADFMRSAAADYMVACEEANERLRRCGQLLNQGLRSEALQLAETGPKLLDIVATLDFPERPQWIARIRGYGIVPPPDLLMDVAADLNEAYALEQPLSAVLARHRLLALSRAPLFLRIPVLRQLAELDPQNGVWREDLAEYERERWKQIQKEIGDAAAKLDAARVVRLREELAASNWLEMPPKTLLDWADTLGSKCIKQAARTKLQELEPALNDAFAAMDLPHGRRLWQEWKLTAPRAELSTGDPLADLAGPALEWLEDDERRRSQEEAHLTAVAKLEAALDSTQLRLDQLEKLHHAAVRDGFSVPPALQSRVDSRVEALQLQARRRIGAMTALGLATAAGLGVVVWYSVQYAAHRRAIAGQVAAFSALMDDRKIREAETFYVRLKESAPAVAVEPEIEELQVRLTGLIQEENSRREAFQAAMGAVMANGPTSPSAEAIERAEKLARTMDERTELARARDEIQKARQSTLRQNEQSFSEALRSLRVDLAALEKQGLPDDLVQHRAELESIASRSSDLKLQQSSISRELAMQLTPLLARLEVVERGVRQESTRRQRLTQLSRDIGDQTKFAESLMGYAQAFPDTGRAVDFRRVASETHLWKTVEQWNEVISAWNQVVATTVTPQSASELVERVRRFQTTFPNWPGSKTLDQKLPFVTAIANRTQDGRALQDILIQLFNDELVANLWMIELNDGSRYYLRTEPREPSSGSLKFRYLTDFKLTEKGRGLDPATVAKRGIAPQSRIAKEVLELLEQVDHNKWEQTFIRIIELVCEPPKEGGPELDVLLQMRLLQQTLQIACDGSYALQQVLETDRKALANSKVNPLANWLDPLDKSVDDERLRAQREMKPLIDALSKLDQVAVKLREFRMPLGPRLNWVGWLQRTGSNQWRCDGLSPKSQLRLYVVHQSDDDRPVLELVGTADHQGVRITNTSAKVLIEGRPVFAVSQPPTAKRN